jgi:hypothetical protein
VRTTKSYSIQQSLGTKRLVDFVGGSFLQWWCGCPRRSQRLNPQVGTRGNEWIFYCLSEKHCLGSEILFFHSHLRLCLFIRVPSM